MLQRASSERARRDEEAELRRVNSLPQLRVVGFDAATAPVFGGSPTISKRAAAIRVDDYLAARESSWGSAASTGSSSLTRSLSLDPRKSGDGVGLGERGGESDTFSNDSMDGDLGGPRQRFSEGAIEFDARGGVDDDAPPRSASAEPIEIQYNGTRNWRRCVFSRLFAIPRRALFPPGRRRVDARSRVESARRDADDVLRRVVASFPRAASRPRARVEATAEETQRKPSALPPLFRGRDRPIACEHGRGRNDLPF
jgi:hypothetical protein